MVSATRFLDSVIHVFINITTHNNTMAKRLRARNTQVDTNPRFRRKPPSGFIKDNIKIIEVKQPYSQVMAEGLALYSEAFPDKDEREPQGMIRERVRDYQSGDSCHENTQFHVLTAVDTRADRVVGYTQWSTLTYEANVGYFEYICVDPDYRRMGIFTELEAARLTVSDNDLRTGKKGRVRGSIREAEFIGQGKDESAREFTKARLEIHQRNGERAVLLERDDGSLAPFWMQPPLTASSDPIMLHLLFQEAEPVKRDPENVGEMPKETLRDIISGMMNYFSDGYFDSLMIEAKKVAELTENGIKESIDGVTLATKLMMRKIRDAKRVLLVPPTETETIDSYAQRCANLAQQIKR